MCIVSLLKLLQVLKSQTIEGAKGNVRIKGFLFSVLVDQLASVLYMQSNKILYLNPAWDLCFMTRPQPPIFLSLHYVMYNRAEMP